ncbi:hypothetical protein DCCM_2014 [Desulfocucumis palustris]|uniref:Uncharacterized protein n=1 Tax=Desulfocucumis palustris TaxID=1898651 RepID=A0A2L2X9I0_9FIRM|nr:hypothetical protein DCCM_2014 [Desulfocucumis palustris]
MQNGRNKSYKREYLRWNWEKHRKSAFLWGDKNYFCFEDCGNILLYIYSVLILFSAWDVKFILE